VYNEKIYNELIAIKSILAFQNTKVIEQNLSEIIKTKPRRLMWVYLDGNRNQKEIAKLVGVQQPAVSKFLNKVKLSGLIEYPQGKAPYRILDYIPPSWLELIGDKDIFDEGTKEERRTLDEFK